MYFYIEDNITNINTLYLGTNMGLKAPHGLKNDQKKAEMAKNCFFRSCRSKRFILNGPYNKVLGIIWKLMTSTVWYNTEMVISSIYTSKMWVIKTLEGLWGISIRKGINVFPRRPDSGAKKLYNTVGPESGILINQSIIKKYVIICPQLLYTICPLQ